MTVDRVRVPEVWRLAWRDVDPAARPAFDPDGVAALVRALPPAAEVPPPGADWRIVDFWYDWMTAALAARLGDWVAGWGFTVAMEDYGGHGVIPVWRGERPDVTTPAETLTRLAAAVVAWHELLVELAADGDGGDRQLWRAVGSDGPYVVLTGPPPARRLPHPSQLSWADVDPAGRGFDPETVEGAVSELVATYPPPAPDADWRLVDLWLENVTVGLVDRYGLRAVGWRWSVGEGDLDGGPIGAWCCVPHSVTTPAATAALISAALVEWHDWLEELAERFRRFLPLPAGEVDGWERAVAHLVTVVGDRTRYESAWYSCVRTVLGWFLDAAGVEAARRAELLDHAISGRFDSWVEPPPAVVESVAGDLARRVGR